MIIYHYGDIFTSKADIICHQVSCQGIMGSGIAKTIKGKYPKAYRHYKEKCNEWHKQFNGDTSKILGRLLITDIQNPYIAHLFGQDGYGRDKRYTDYDSLEKAFNGLKTWLLDFDTSLPADAVIAIPYKMGCGLAGGNWAEVEHIINTVFNNSMFEIQVWNNRI